MAYGFYWMVFWGVLKGNRGLPRVPACIKGLFAYGLYKTVFGDVFKGSWGVLVYSTQSTQSGSALGTLQG